MPVGYSIYVEKPSFVHQRIDPRTKLACLLVTFALALEFNHPIILGLFLLAVIAIGLEAQLPLRNFRPFLLSAAWFVVLGVIIWPFYVHGGPTLFVVAGVSFTLTGIGFGLAMGLRVGLMVTAAGVWMMTSSPQKTTLGLMRVGLPDKAGLAMSTAIRFVPLINGERLTIMEAQRARGLDLQRGNPLARSLRYVAVIGPMLVRSLDIAQALAVAMDARGFGARARRTSIIEIGLTRLDRAILVGCLAAVIVGLVCRILGIGLIVNNYL